MTPSERVTVLKELLPGLKPVIYEILAADSNTIGGEFDWNLEFVEPLVDVMKRLRFNDEKMQRTTNHCGAAGAQKLKDRAYYRFKALLRNEHLKDYALATEVAGTISAESSADAEAIVDVINELVESRPTGLEHVKFDLTRVRRMMAVEKHLKHRGQITVRTPMEDAVSQIRSWVNRWEKMEASSPNITMAEVFGETRPREEFPDMLFGDNTYGDGTRLVQAKDKHGNETWKRTSLFEPLVPEFEGMDPMKIKEEVLRRVVAKAEKGNR